MADVKICDRCGDYYPGRDEDDDRRPITDELYITTQQHVTVSVSEDDLKRTGAVAAAQLGTRSATKFANVETKDLCEECQAEFEDFWEHGGEFEDFWEHGGDGE